jgi:hypothetical protein
VRKKGIVLTTTFLLVFTLVLSLSTTAFADPPAYEEVAAGLNNPRGLAFAPNGDLYIAEAGAGGDGPCASGPEGDRCYGASGSITRVDFIMGIQERIAEGMPSLAGEGGLLAIGPHDIAFQGTGGAFIAMGFGGEPEHRETDFGPAGADLAQLTRMTASGNWWSVADLGDFEGYMDPTGDGVDTNPYSVLALPGKQIVVDAGGNDLLEIDANGNISVLATFPARLVDAPPFLGLPPGFQIPMESVPTSVAQGPDGDFYVGELTGFPFPVDGANVYRVPAEGGSPVVVASGFTAIVDVGFDADGNLYVLEIVKNGLLAVFSGGGDWTGSLVRVNGDGSQTEIASMGLFAPGGMTFGPDGMFYVTNNSILPGLGQVLKIQP